MKKAIFFSIIIGIFTCCTHKKTSHNKELEISPGIYVLDSKKPIKSLDELTSLFKGEPIYIDRWATWCDPCIEEFKFNKPLRNFLNSHNIELVYLNADKDIQTNKYYKFIKHHNLIGYHLRLNTALKKDLIDRGVFIPRIPQYIVIGKVGNVITNKALRPSNGDSLYTQLENLIK